MNKDLVGNIHHNVQPVIGWLRMALHNDKPMTTAQMEAAVEKLYLALDNADRVQ